MTDQPKPEYGHAFPGRLPPDDPKPVAPDSARAHAESRLAAMQSAYPKLSRAHCIGLCEAAVFDEVKALCAERDRLADIFSEEFPRAERI